MKSLETVLKKREELKKKLEQLRQESYSVDIKVMTSLERRDYARLMGVIKMLKIQIDALTYVINYDSEMEDVVNGEKEMN